MENSGITDVTPISNPRDNKTPWRNVKQLPPARKLNKAPTARFVDYSGPRDIRHIRRDNLRVLVGKYTPGVVAQKGGWKSTSFISQMTGESNPITESTARRVETALGLPEGYMDVDHTVPQPVQAAFGMPNTPPASPQKPEIYGVDKPTLDVELLSDVLQRVAMFCQVQNLVLNPVKHAELVSAVFDDATEHDNTVRDTFIRRMLRMIA